MSKPIRRLLVANRSEIATRIFRSAHELGIRTVAIYSREDMFALHRFKADEAYQIGKAGEPVRSYLDIDAIVALCKEREIDAVHPGYGFLSENAHFARALEKAGVTFVGPRVELLEKLGDKTTARTLAEQAGVPVLPGTPNALTSAKEARKAAGQIGFPIMIKAAFGGGGRGMRAVQNAEGLDAALAEAQREAGSAFGASDVFLEKLITRARHIEVQLLGDRHGNLIHIFERDCSVQRRNQKVVEIAPAPNLAPELRKQILEAAIAIGRQCNYDNAGTVEFLVDVDSGKFYFIEVNPRIQVEHTVTEAISGIDIVRAQILVAQGTPLGDQELGLESQDRVQTIGWAIQCRVTTEDPENHFIPDYGRLTAYRSASGMGIRLDAGSAFGGAIITPYYDSLLVKVTATGRRYIDAARGTDACLQEFRVRGVKSNIPFLINLIKHPTFLAGECTTRFIDQTPELFHFVKRQDRATKLLTYVADVIVNGHSSVPVKPKGIVRSLAPLPEFDRSQPPQPGTRQLLDQMGAEKFCKWILKQDRLLLTDTTLRDAHQSLLATRVRSFDMLRIADAYAHMTDKLFSLEMWGGATFDTTMRFLRESPWDRLAELRTRVPNILFQMLLRASNAVGYTTYPDNVVTAFVKESASAGIDVFRIFDSLNWVPNMREAMDAVLESGKLCEAAICYTGDLLNPDRSKYDLKYYVELAKELEKLGAHILGIKDMAGLCKPYAAEKLVKALKQEIGIPIHFHTHDTAGVQAGAILKAAEAGVDIADAALASMSGMTSQPSLNAVVESLRFTKRDTGLVREKLDRLSDYWEHVRKYYQPFEGNMIAPLGDIYLHEMPGGQYTNLYQQAQSMGLEKKWRDVCRTYAEVNQMLGDIVKVTPSSKVVGDLALFMVSNGLTPADVLDDSRPLAFPESVVELLEGKLGKPPGGFPKKLQKRVLGDRTPVRGRPGAGLKPVDFDAVADELREKVHHDVTFRDVLSYVLYPRVYLDYAEHVRRYSDLAVLPTSVYFYGLEPNEDFQADIEEGKTLFVKLLTVGDPHGDGGRTVFFELNGQPREIRVVDKSLESTVRKRSKAEADNPNHVAAPMPGLVVHVGVHPGEQVKKGQRLMSIEAMKMETSLYASKDTRILQVHVGPGEQVEAGDLLIETEPTK